MHRLFRSQGRVGGRKGASVERFSAFVTNHRGPIVGVALVLALLCLFSIKKCGLNPIVAIVASGVAGIFLFGGV